MTTPVVLTVDDVRRLSGDVEQPTYFTDANVAGFIAAAPSGRPYYAVYLAMQSLATQLALNVGSVTVLGYSGDGLSVAAYLQQSSRKYLYVAPMRLPMG